MEIVYSCKTEKSGLGGVGGGGEEIVYSCKTEKVGGVLNPLYLKIG